MNSRINKTLTYKNLIFLFLVSVGVRFIFSNYFPKTINCYPDELLYLSAAESLWDNHAVMVFNLVTSFKKVGYSFFIAPAFAIDDVHLRMSIIGLINSVLMSIGLFPVYGIAKRVLKENKLIWLSLLMYLISPSMTYTMTFASENLFIPVSLVVLYVIVEIASRENKWNSKENIGLIALGVVSWIVAYITKELALVIPLALVAYIVLENVGKTIKNKKDKNAKSDKKNIIKVLILLVAVVVAIFAIWWVSNHGSNYYQLGFNLDFIIDRFSYFIYGVGFFITISVVGLLEVPVLMPLIYKRELSKEAKTLYYLMLLIIVATALIVSYTIFVYEDYPSLAPRAHVRYVEYMYVPFMIVLLSLLEGNNKSINAGNGIETNSKIASDKKKVGKFGVCAVVVTVVIMIFIFHGFNGQTIDHTTLFYMQLFAEDGKTFAPAMAKILILAVSIIAIVLMALYQKNEKRFWKIFILGAIMMSLGNTVLSGYVQYKTHTHTEVELTEMNEIREFVKAHPDATFMAAESVTGEEMLDTFLMDCDNVVYVEDAILYHQCLLGDRGVDLDEGPLWGKPVAGGVNYEKVKDIDYMIIFTDEFTLLEDAEIIKEYPANGCNIYKVKDTRRLPKLGDVQ